MFSPLWGHLQLRPVGGTRLLISFQWPGRFVKSPSHLLEGGQEVASPGLCQGVASHPELHR